MKQKKKIWLVTLAIAFTLALFGSCTRMVNYFNPGQSVAQDNNDNRESSVAQDNNDNRGSSVAQDTHYYFGPYISVVTGTLTSKTIITTERRGNSATYLYMLNTAGPINISKVNVPNDGDVITANNITAFELAFCNMNLSAYIGSKVRVTGQFTLCDSRNDSTRVVMNVSKVEIYNTTPVPQQCPPPVPQQCLPPVTQQRLPPVTQQCPPPVPQQCPPPVPQQCLPPVTQQRPTPTTKPAVTQQRPSPTTKPAVTQQCPPPTTKPAVAQQRPTPTTKTYRIQVGAYINFANACNAMTQLKRQNLNPVTENYQQYTRVVLRRIPENRVENTLQAVRRAGFNDPWIQPDTSV